MSMIWVYSCDDSDDDNCDFIDVDLCVVYFVCCQNMQYKCLDFFWVRVDFGYGLVWVLVGIGYGLAWVRVG